SYPALAELYAQTKRPDLADEYYQKGIRLLEQMAHDYPGMQWLALSADRMRVQRLLHQARHGRGQALLPSIKSLSEKKGLPGDMYYNLGCVFALLANNSGNPKVAEDRARQALLLLSRAESSGFFRTSAQVSDAQKDEDLKALRGRDDFQKFLSRLQEEHKPP